MFYDLEHYRHNLESLADWYASNMARRNEATTRLQLIDRLFFECLGWSKENDVVLEEPHGGDYADYTFFAPRRILIVEAKREGNYFEAPVGKDKLEYPIHSLMHDYPNLKTAIEQVAGYCQSRGVPFAVVCNGHQIVAFVATRDDGLPPFEGKALVFPSLAIMLDKFHDLWQVLSKPGVEQKRLYINLTGNKLPELPPKLSANIPEYPGVVNRNVFQADLQVVSELVMEDLTRSRELETEFLETCYCKSSALSQYSLMSKSILQARYAALSKTEASGHTIVPAVTKEGISPALLSESFSRRPILLIGDVGVGKSSFIRHLIRVDAKEIFENGLYIYIDLGSQANFSDLKTFIPEEVARQLRENYGMDIEERNIVRGIYHADLQRFSKGIYSDLKETNPNFYKEREINFLEEKLQKKEEHLKNVLEHIKKAQTKQVVMFLDNSDQRDDSTQQQTFLIAQEMADHWPVLVFVALRPETYYRSLKIGALSGYHPKAFTISPPRVDQVIEKRLEFALKLTSGEIPFQSLNTSVKIQLTTMDKIIHIFLDSLSYDSALKVFIDNISSGNIRLALDLVKGFFGSGLVDTQKIVNKYDETGTYFIPLHEFLRAVIYGDSRYYEPDRSPIANIFDISYLDPKEHFLLPLLIGVLASSTDPNVEEGFVNISRVYEQLQGLGFTPNQIDLAIVRGHAKNLTETGARRVPQPGILMPQTLRVTPIGLYHINRLCHQFTYIDAIVVDTPILDKNKAKNILSIQNIIDRLDRAETFRLYLDDQWALIKEAASKTAFNWSIVSEALRRDIQYIRPRAMGR